jgi:hypothetical protein
MSAAKTQGQAKPAAMGGTARMPAQQLRPNPSIERTPYGMLRMPSVAAHVER